MAIWKLLRGVHVDKKARLVEARKEPMIGVERKEGDGTFYPGEVFETKSDLSGHNNSPERKFQKLDDYEPITPEATNDGLESMTIAGLRAMAEDNEIDLGEAVVKKAEIIEVLRIGLSGAAV